MPDTELLKAVFSTNTRWAEWSTIAVFFGLLGDIFVMFAFDMRDKTKSRWEIGLAFAASVIIAIGVFGEWRFGHVASSASGELQAHLENETAQANERTEEARAENIWLARAAIERHAVAPGLGIPGVPDRPMLRGYLSDLSKFSGTEIAIQTARDSDAENFGRELVAALDMLKWKPQLIDEKRSHVVPGEIIEGVMVWYPIGKPWRTDAPNQPWFAWHDAAEALANSLTTGGFGVADMPVGRVGFVNKKPDWPFSVIPYFDPPFTGVYLQIGPRPISFTFQWVEDRRKRAGR
jgi:hypothetical protein